MTSTSPQARATQVEPGIALVTDDVYRVMSDRQTLGYIHRVGLVYVALRGEALGHAVEVGQSMTWDQAIEMVRGSR